jgi:hypothetical protein
MLQPLLKKLIKTAAGRTRFILAVLGLSIAMILILAAVQLQENYNNLLNSKTNQDSVANFLVLNKILNNKTYGTTAITNADIDSLKKQSFIEEVGVLTPSLFKASVESFSERFPFSTDISFESVPPTFIDVQTKDWNWNENSTYIPMIAPNMFLDFYNFQFSLSQNLPQLTQEAVKMLIFKVNIQTNAGTKSFNGRIVGFSDRITSLLIPESFMNWANAHYSNESNVKPSRVVVKTKDPGNPVLVKYLKDKGLTTDADKTRFSKYRQIVNTVVNISWITGFVLLLFALLIFTLFIQLTVSSCKNEIQQLVLLGAAPKQLQSFLIKQFFPSNIFIVMLSLFGISTLQYWAANFLAKQNMYIETFISIKVLITAVIVLAVLWFTNYYTIKKYIRS